LYLKTEANIYPVHYQNKILIAELTAFQD